MRVAVGVDGREAQTASVGRDLPSLLSQVRFAMITGAEQEFVRCKELAPLEVTAAQYAILKNVLKGSAESACDLCRLMDYDRGAMSRMIDRLEMKRLVRRVPLAHTRRAVALEVTDEGKAAFPIMEACVERVVARLVAGIPKSQLREMELALRQMLANA
jgi:DNA-binding MarR family transcriptional regulator